MNQDEYNRLKELFDENKKLIKNEKKREEKSIRIPLIK